MFSRTKIMINFETTKDKTLFNKYAAVRWLTVND